MERADIKLAIDMLEGVKMEEPCEDNMAIDHCINVLEDCGNDIASLRQQVATLTEQRDLAVEALKKCRYRSLCDEVVDKALTTIQSSEVKK